MRPEVSSYLFVAVVTFGVTVLTVPLSLFAAKRLNLVAAPDENRVHKDPTPMLGGAAMYAGFVAGFCTAWWSGLFAPVFATSTEPYVVLIAATVAFVVGVVDDARDLSPPAKTIGVCVAASALVIGGVSIIWFRVPFLNVFVLPTDFTLLVTIFWVLGMANAVNFIDGLDGLAAGVVGIGAAAFMLYSLRLSDVGLLVEGNVGPLVAVLVVGICAGFLPWNVYPARIFMGDSGSLLLGTMMAASTMAVGGRTSQPFSGQTFFFYAPLVIPLVILGVPILDTFFAIVRRASSGQGVATADKNHLHHRLVRLGHGHRRSVFILWSWTFLLSAFVLYPTYNEGQGDGIVPLGVGTAALILLTLFKPGFQLRSAVNRPVEAIKAVAVTAAAGDKQGAIDLRSNQKAPRNGAEASGFDRDTKLASTVVDEPSSEG